MNEWNRGNERSLSANDVASLQQDAIRRVREMQARAQASIAQAGEAEPGAPEVMPVRMEEHTRQVPSHPPQQRGLLDMLGLQTDQLLILLMLFVMLGNSRGQSDDALMLALVYLLF